MRGALGVDCAGGFVLNAFNRGHIATVGSVTMTDANLLGAAGGTH